MSDAGDALGTATAVVRLALELGALVAFGYWGYRAGDGPAGVALAVVLPVAVAAVWALFGSPRAPSRLGWPARLGLEAALLGGAALALFGAGPYWRRRSGRSRR